MFLVVGDWNCVTKGADVEKNYELKRSASLTNLETAFSLVDVYRILHPEASAADFTFYRPSVSRSTELTSPKQRGRT